MILYNAGFVFNGQEEVEAHFVENNNYAANPGVDFEFSSVDGHVTDPINLTPDATLEMTVNSEYLPSDDWFYPVGYIGAFAVMEQTGSHAGRTWNNWDCSVNGFKAVRELAGCMYNFACNFDPNATVDDGSL